MLRKALENGTNDHDYRACHDAPPSSPALIAVGRNGNRKNGTELVAGRDEAE
jgi:hypothetical protein